jgi:hypothetical protein
MKDKMEQNPITQLQDKNDMMDMGRMGFHVYSGATEEGATQEVAMMIVIGYFAGIAASNHFKMENEENAGS